jgi:hypothetical protein
MTILLVPINGYFINVIVVIICLFLLMAISCYFRFITTIGGYFIISYNWCFYVILQLLVIILL